MRVIEGLVSIYQQPRDEVKGMYIDAIARSLERQEEQRSMWPDIRRDEVLNQLSRLMQLGRETSLIIRRGLKAKRELVFLGGRFRLPLSSATL